MDTEDYHESVPVTARERRRPKRQRNKTLERSVDQSGQLEFSTACDHRICMVHI